MAAEKSSDAEAIEEVHSGIFAAKFQGTRKRTMRRSEELPWTIQIATALFLLG
jgi:hypothetical protein